MFAKTLTAGVLAVSLTLTSLTPTTATAQISDEDAIAGLITLLLFGAVVHNSRNRAEPAAPQPQPQAEPRVQRGWRVLPDECLRQATRRNGRQIRFFAQRCLNRSYAHTDRLPAACHVRFRTENGNRRQGYRARCMRNEGFRTNRH